MGDEATQTYYYIMVCLTSPTIHVASSRALRCDSYNSRRLLFAIIIIIIIIVIIVIIVGIIMMGAHEQYAISLMCYLCRSEDHVVHLFDALAHRMNILNVTEVKVNLQRHPRLAVVKRGVLVTAPT